MEVAGFAADGQVAHDAGMILMEFGAFLATAGATSALGGMDQVDVDLVVVVFNGADGHRGKVQDGIEQIHAVSYKGG